MFYKTAVGKEISFFAAAHKEATRDGFKSLGGADYLQGRADHISGGMNGASNQSVGVSAFDHHGSEINVVQKSAFSDFERDSFGFADFIKSLYIFLAFFGCSRINDSD